MVRRIKEGKSKDKDKTLTLAKADENYCVHPLLGLLLKLIYTTDRFSNIDPVLPEDKYSTKQLKGLSATATAIISDITESYTTHMSLALDSSVPVQVGILKELRKTEEHKEIERNGYTVYALKISKEIEECFDILDSLDVYISRFLELEFSKPTFNRIRNINLDLRLRFIQDEIRTIVGIINDVLAIDRDSFVREYNKK